MSPPKSPGRVLPKIAFMFAPVDVDETADTVQHVGDFGDVALEEPKRVRVGHHKDGSAIVELSLEFVEVYKTVATSGELHTFKASQGRAWLGSCREH